MTGPNVSAGPLSGVQILDLTSVIMGPLATQMLGDLGADIIAIEDRSGDTNRYMGAGAIRDMSGVSMNLMRNKRSVSLDLKSDAGRDVALRLAATSDVVVTNLRPGPLGRLRLTYDDIIDVKPNVVFCQAQGYPTDSPQADAPAYDDIIQSASGIGDLFQRQGNDPMLVPTLIADKVCGMAIASAITAALYHRARTGEGQRIEVPMVDVMRSFLLVEHGAGAITEPRQTEPGYSRILTPERRPQRTSDGWINVLPYSADHYRKLFIAGERTDLLDDMRISSRTQRIANADSLYRDVASILASRTTDEWLRFCSAEDIPATGAATLDDLIDELPLATHPHAGDYRVIPSAARFSETPTSVRRHAPLLGEHGREVLVELGFTEDEITALIASNVVHHVT